MQIISVMNQKGGSGKTTVALHLARGLQLQGRTVAVLDVDRQKSATRWGAKAKERNHPGPAVISGTVADLEALGENDIVVVDTAGDFRADAQGQAMAILRRAVLVVVPVLPTPLDVDGAEDLLHALTAAKRSNVTQARVAVVINKATRNRLTTLARQALPHYGHPVITTALGDRMAYAEELGFGRTAFDRKPSDKARLEVTQVVHELWSNDQ